MSPVQRRARQIIVDALLEELAEERQELYRRKTFGVRAAGLESVKSAYEETRRRLAEVSGAAA